MDLYARSGRYVSLALQQVLFSFALTLALLAALARLAPIFKLVDTPDHRKLHSGSVPLVGGIAVFLSLCSAALVWQDSGEGIIAANADTLWVFLAAAAVLTALGVIDDMRGVSVFTRAVVEVAVALIVIEGLDLLPKNLGDLIGTGNIRLADWVAYPFTVIAIFGLVNAYNMLDGIDGLLSVMVLITVLAFHVFTGLEPGLITLTLAASLSAFLVSNLGLSPYISKTFLGDAGSKLLGFIVVALILAVTSVQVGGRGTKYIEPVTALYLVALPLFDMVFITLRRLYGRRSPFGADRTHIHHLMQALDMSHRRSLTLIGCAGLAPPFIGLMLDRAGAATPQQFFIFLGMFAMYCLFMSQAWRVAARFQALKEQSRLKVSYNLETAPSNSLTSDNEARDELSRITH